MSEKKQEEKAERFGKQKFKEHFKTCEYERSVEYGEAGDFPLLDCPLTTAEKECEIKYPEGNLRKKCKEAAQSIRDDADAIDRLMGREPEG